MPFYALCVLMWDAIDIISILIINTVVYNIKRDDLAIQH